ncbi:MAG: PspC domain-containing protein [Candidatus Cyclobacteriaceae bacterium M3_2C_046]
MKKNISINISGIIFYIEEDGYDRLKEYLDSINRYFSKFDDSKEIISDIESRIAEIFLAKLKDGRQVVTAEDVESLIATMGSIKDFKAIEEPEDSYQEEARYEEPHRERIRSKKLFRDNKRKIIGGVASGLGHYFNIDPLWIRLLFVLFFVAFFFEFEVSFVVGLIYVIMWIIIPGSDDLKNEKKFKKMFRNPDDKVLGGVSSGVAAYFGVDVVLVRLLFVIFIFVGGTGLIVYLILWTIVPEAKSLTDKMEMQGEPVTLSNIESNLKKSFNVKEGEENILMKILLFPFRLIAYLINAISQYMGPLLHVLVDIIRIIAGIILVIIGVSTLVGLVIALGGIIGIFAGGGDIFLQDLFPLEVIKNTIPSLAYVALFLVIAIPFVYVAILGLMIIARKNMIRPALGWSLFAVWVLGLVFLAFTVPGVARNYSRFGEKEVVEYIDLNNQTAILTLDDDEPFQEYETVTLTLRGYQDSVYKLVKNFEARGKTQEDAVLNTEMVNYQVNKEDSTLIFNSKLNFEEKAKFRVQKLDMTLFIPYNQQFIMDRSLRHILRNTLYRNGFSVSQMDNNRWMFTEQGLQCVTCELSSPEEPSQETITYDYNEIYDFKDFRKLDIGSAIFTEIRQSDQFEVEVSGPENEVEDLEFSLNGEELKIRMKNNNLFNYDSEPVKLSIALPELTELDLHGSTRTFVSDFEAASLYVNLSGAAYADMEIDSENLEVALSGATKLVLKGKADYLEAGINSNAILDAFDLSLERAQIDANAAASANLNARDFINVKATGAATVRYKGNPKVSSETTFSSSVKKVE